jgi:hypothetical protein
MTARAKLPAALLLSAALALPLAVAGPAFAARGSDGTDPADPGTDPAAEEPVKDCPTELWTVPLEIKGLGCILLLPKNENL